MSYTRTMEQMTEDGYVLVSDSTLRVQLWEKYEGPTGMRLVTDSVVYDTVLMTLRDAQKQEYDVRDYNIMSQNADFLEVLTLMVPNIDPAVEARMKLNRFVGNDLRTTGP